MLVKRGQLMDRRIGRQGGRGRGKNKRKRILRGMERMAYKTDHIYSIHSLLLSHVCGTPSPMSPQERACGTAAPDVH